MELDLKNSWNRWAEKHKDPYLSVHRSSEKAQLDLIVQDIIKKMSLHKEEKLLDVGCGSGVLLSKLVKETEAIGIGIDFSEKEIEIAKDHFPHIQFHVGNAESIPFPDHTFDKILCYSVLHYIKDWRPAIRELLRMCRDGGMVLLGDLPSISHRYKLYWDYLKKVPRIFLHLSLLRKSLEYREATPWYWMDLKAICRYLDTLGVKGEILPQPEGHRQYGGNTANYRLDILVRKGSLYP
jgi:ubiquinone/menaquinone biosynthesis C-methylase UbiE